MYNMLCDSCTKLLSFNWIFPTDRTYYIEVRSKCHVVLFGLIFNQIGYIHICICFYFILIGPIILCFDSITFYDLLTFENNKF